MNQSLQRNFVSEWSLRDKIRRALWMIVGGSLFRFSFHNMYGWRNFLLRFFGAKLGQRVRVRPTARIEVPWQVELGDDVVIGDFATLYSLGPIKIGAGTVVSQHCYLCAGTHDHNSRTFMLLRLPITVGQDCWLAADVFVGPDVVIGDRSVVGARSSVFKNVPSDVVVVGTPARFLKARDIER